MKSKETWIYSKKHKGYVKANKWMLFIREIKRWIYRYKITDTWKYNLIPRENSKYYFKMSPKEYEKAHKIYKERGTISYEFYPCGGIGWGLKIHTKDGEIINITDYNHF